jgi:Porin PorA
VRRAISLVLLTLGIFGVAMGLLLRLYAYPRLALAPLNPDATTRATGTATVFYPADLKQHDGVDVIATRRVQGKIDSPEVKINGGVAVWEMGLVTEDTNGGLVDAVDQWVCVDRRNAQALHPCTDEKVNGDASVAATGLQYKFPFHTGRHDYSFYDVATNTAPLIHFDGVETIDGLSTYRFVQQVPITKIANLDVPASLAGGTGDETVTAGRMYEDVRTVWVEPATGTIVKGQEKIHQFLRGPDGNDGQVLFDGTLVFTPDTVAAQVKQAKSDRAKVGLLYDAGPRLIIGAGILLALIGLGMLLWSARRTRRPRPDPDGGPRHEAAGPRHQEAAGAV